MSTRAGRLLADIIMSIAKGYIDNLREETMKGLYGRLRQGIYPFKAPRGYLNTGGGNIKIFDPVLAPLIKEAFELYAEGNQSLSNITTKLASKGLITSNGNPISKNILSLILHNPFYIGLMKVKGEVFKGKHEPLVTDKLFNKVQRMFEGTTVAKCKHDHLYRRSIKCVCGFGLVSERQNGRVYYRCQNKLCNEKTMREDRVSYVIEKHLKSFVLDSRVIKLIQYQIALKTDSDNVSGKEALESIKLRLSNTEGRFEKLTNLLLDGVVGNDDYLKKKEQLLKEQSLLLEQEKTISRNVNNGARQRIQKLLENSQSLYQQYNLGNKHQKRSLLKKTFSKLELMGGRLVIETNKPFLLLLNNPSVLSCYQDCCAERNKKENFSREEIKRIAYGFIEYAITEC